FDPVNGLPPVVLYAVSQFDGNLDEFDRQEAFRPETTDDRTSYKFSGYMADQVKYLGGEDAVSKFVNTVEIQFVDGETREFYVETHDKTLRSLFAAVMEFGSAGAGVHLSEEPTRFFSTRDIAWIRFPSFHVVGYMKIEV
ncbi:hypothetical protein, partial [Roseibium sp.]|uniref:hypothetical protein n=1 Tax=Roseibium sp. TaxID=1936156 RepID=UPI003297D3E1